MIRIISRAAFLLAFFGIATGAAIAQPFAYVTNQNANSVSGYTLDSLTGALTELPGSPFLAGTEPTSLKATPSGKFVYVTNYHANTISAYRLKGTNGALSEIAGSPFSTGSYPYTVDISPSGKFLYTADNNYGGTGIPGISAFSIDGATGSLAPVTGSPFSAGGEPLSLAFTPSGKYLYVSNAAADEHDVYAFAVNSDGSLTDVPGSPYTAGTYPWALAVSPSGKFLYVPNWDSNTISAFSIDGTSGALTEISGSPFAVSTQASAVAITPSGQFLYTTGTANGVAAYKINRTTGALTPISGSPFPGSSSSWAAICSSGEFLYAVDDNSNQVSGYSINATTGALTLLASSPYPAGEYPTYLAFANPAVKSCGALDVSAEATLAPGPYTHQPRTDLWDETLTITNGVTPISGPLSVVLLGLPTPTTTLSGTYTTTYCYSTAGNYVVPIDALLPGEVLFVPFVFQATQDGVTVHPTPYKAKLISGTLNK